MMKKIILFGASSFAEKILMFPSLIDKNRISYFVDNSVEKWGTFFLNKKVFSPEILKKENKQDILVIIASTFYEQISTQLEMMGLCENIHFFNGSSLFNYQHQLKLNKKVAENSVQISKNFSPLLVNELIKYKKSDTLFIMGSGSSINRLTEKEWAEINQHDSFGFNNWIMHKFVPTYYCAELPSVKNERLYKTYVFNLLKRINRDDYINVPSILKDGMYNSFQEKVELKKEIFICNDIEIGGSSIGEFEQELRLLDYLGFFDRQFNNNKLHILFRKRASIAFLTLFGVMAGYKNIVLCGVDLNTPNYFFQENETEYRNSGFIIPLININNETHGTINPNLFNGITIDKVLNTINNILLKPRHIKLYVAKKSSALYPQLPCYF